MPANQTTRQAKECAWQRVSNETPCPVCTKTDYCRIGVKFIHCMRIESDKPGKTSGWYHLRDDNQFTAALLEAEPAKPQATDEQLDGRFRKNLPGWLRAATGTADLLATELWVSIHSLQRLGVGRLGKAWTIPERTPSGLIVGVSLRYDDGKKRMLPESRHGLAYTSDLFDAPQRPLFLVEGMTDTASCLTLGIMAIGRPSNVCGGEMLLELLRGKWRGPIVVMGENDRREPKPIASHPHKPTCKCCQRCWPGRYGAEAVAKLLREPQGGPPVSIRMPPVEYKDFRHWANQTVKNPEDTEACRRIGESFLRLLHIHA